MSVQVDLGLVDRLQRLQGLSWISDAPLFIDDDLVGRFFDAIVRPAFEHESVTEEESKQRSTAFKAAAEAAAKAELKAASWIPDWLFPLKGELTLTGGLEGGGELGSSSSRISQLKPIWNAERQLEELTRHYFQFHPGRMLVGERPFDDHGVPKDWSLFGAETTFFTEVPRALAFIDLLPGTKIIPTAAEFEDGTVSLLYKDLVQRLTNEHGGPSRDYPSNPADKNGRKAYWASFDKGTSPFDSAQAMLAIEEASKAHNRIRWIDFRVLMGNDGDTMHLHLVSAAKADAGLFGYNFVRRAHNHGVRLVGTLKSGPDLNVMAIYDK